MNSSVLIVTIPPLRGGVPVKARILAEHLRDSGHAVTVAHYATLSDYPELTAPSWRMIAGQRATSRDEKCFGDFPCVAIGCALPELEFTYYLPSMRWRDVIRAHDRHIAVGGTVLVSYPLTAMGIPHLVWCASTMQEDRMDRRRAMPAARRLFDRMVIGPVQRRMERRILAGPGRFMAVSSHTQKTLIAAGGTGGHFTALPVPVDERRFEPPPQRARAGILGFAGRAGDPRKNIPLLMDAVRRLVEKGCDIELRLTGTPDSELERAAAHSGISERIRWQGWLAEDELADFFRGLDIFVIPSFQEGLNIAGLQALACGVPVVSTRCGGPEDYVIDGATGFLTGFDGAELADAIHLLIENRNLRFELGAGARRLIEQNFTIAGFRKGLESAWQTVWQERAAP
ncbi:MAG: glycosyltransferase family 4 protein [Alphaproteobacteria bacterium]